MLKDKTRKKRSKLWQVSKEEFERVVKEKTTFTEILNAFGLKMHGGNNKTLKERIEFEKIDISHILNARKELNKKHLKAIHVNNTRDIKDILVENSTYKTNFHLKERLLKQGLLKEECEGCGIGPTWNGKPLKLQLEHKNGINNDNRLENLCLLCPNCHSQTDTYCGKSLRKYYYCKNIECNKQITSSSETGFCVTCLAKYRDNSRQTKVQYRPSRIELIELILNQPFTKIGKRYEVSDNAVRKWCKSEGLPSRAKDIKAQKEQLQKELEKAKLPL